MFYLATLTLGLAYFTAQVVVEALRRMVARHDIPETAHAASIYHHPNQSPQEYQLSREALHNLKHPRP